MAKSSRNPQQQDLLVQSYIRSVQGAKGFGARVAEHTAASFSVANLEQRPLSVKVQGLTA